MEAPKAGPSEQRKRKKPFSRKTAPRTYGTRRTSRWGQDIASESDESDAGLEKATGGSEDEVDGRESMLSRLEEQGERVAASEALEDADDPIQDSLPTQAVPLAAAQAAPSAAIASIAARLPVSPLRLECFRCRLTDDGWCAASSEGAGNEEAEPVKRRQRPSSCIRLS